jgi:DNA-binding NarL/FixJ family response regulator
VVHIGVVDDHTFLREWLGRAGALRPHHHVVARAADATEFASVMTKLPDRRCDVVLLDLRTTPQRDRGRLTEPCSTPVQGRNAVELLLRTGMEAVAAGRLASTPAILIYTEVPEPPVHVACLIAGASGVVRKRESLDKLGEAIDIVATGGIVVDEPMATLIDQLANRQRLTITDAETATLALAGHGLSRHQIATRLGCAESTVDKHLRSIRNKLGREIPLSDLADSYGLRDLAPPDALTAPVRRARLRSLARLITQRP